MLKNYLKLAWRNIWKSKGTFTINVTGLAVAVVASLILSLSAYRHFIFNNFHENGKSLFQVYQYQHTGKGGEAQSNLPVPLPGGIKTEIPGVEGVTRYSAGGAFYRFGGKNGQLSIRFVDPDFLSMFTFPVINGSKTPLDELSHVAIGEKAAVKWLGSADVVGKQLSLKVGETWEDYTITAVVKDAPDNSDLTFGLLMNYEKFPPYQTEKDKWSNYSTEIFVKMAGTTGVAAFEKYSQGIVKKYYEDNLKKLARDGGKPGADGMLMKFSIIPLADIHFNGISSSGGDVKRAVPYLLLVIAGFILFIACINFINLSVARAFNRAKEMGMRKMMGALRGQLVLQLWGEALMICLIALVTGLVLTYFLLPGYNAWANSKLVLSMALQPVMVLSILGAFLLITVIAGVYPAFVMTKINTVQALKGSVKPGRKNYVRNSLIVVQFSFSALLICCTMVAWQQNNYLRNKPLGYNKEQVISIPLSGDMKRATLVKLLRDRLAAEPNVLSVTAADNNLGRGLDGSMMSSQITFDYKDREVKSHWLMVDYDYVQTLGIKLLAGRDFSRNMASDTGTLVINERMAQELGEPDPVGKFVKLDEDSPPVQIIGLVKDFNFKSLHRKVEPITMVIDNKGNDFSYAYVKVKPDNLPASIAKVQAAWAGILPGIEFKGSFLDENVNRQYTEEKSMSQLFVAGAILTIIISCMGLFAIAIMAITQRTKEIGIRKVLGASVTGIVGMLYRDFLKLVIVAIVIATPVAWYAMSQWLSSFAYSVGLHWWVFVLAGASAIVIALCTVSIQSIRAAIANPVKSLRSE